MNDREREPDGYYVNKVYGWRLAVIWLALIALGWLVCWLVFISLRWLGLLIWRLL